MLTRAEKEERVADLKERFERATCVFVVDYRGLDVPSANQLRSRIRGEGKGDFEYRVAKNTLVRRASTDTDVAGLIEYFNGPTALALSYGDPVQLARILADFSKEHEVFELKAGVLDGKVVSPSEISRLATLPSLGAIRAQLVRLVQAPATKIARLVAEPGAQLARLLEARRGQLEEQEGGS